MSDEPNTENPSITEEPSTPGTENPMGEATGAEKAYLRFAPLAQTLPAEQVRSYQGVDALLALYNVESGIQNVIPFLTDKIRAKLEPEEQEQIETISELALALTFAARKVNLLDKTSRDYQEKMARVFKLRSILLYGALSCAHADLIPMANIEKIQRGSGHTDAAQDGIDLVALYRGNASVLVNKTPATPELLKETADLCTLMVAKRIKPARAKESQSAAKTQDNDVDLRNRLWTLLNRYHESLWTAGSLLYKKEVGGYIPELLSAKRSASTPPPPAPPQETKPSTEEA